MTTFERVIECLRPLVETKSWDYYIVWKLGDDPSRFIQWRGCCCCGGFSDCSNVKQERGKEQHLLALCKDTYNQHLATTNTCKALAQFPSSIALYSGVHGEAVISKQPKWLITHANTSTSDNKTGTQVLVPLSGTLIELFTTKHVPRDQKIIDFVTVQCSIYLEQETMVTQTSAKFNIREQHCYTDIDDHPNSWTASVHNSNVHSGLQFLPPVSQPSTFPSFEGSSASSNFSNENKWLKLDSVPVSCNASPENSNGKYSGKEISNLDLTEEQDAELGLGYAYPGANRYNAKANQSKCHSKNLVTERNRRKRIKDGLFALRALVPKITKMDKVTILGDACDYIKELEQSVKSYQDELRAMAEEDSSKNNAESEIPKSNKKVGSKGHSQSCISDGKQAELEIEVSPIGTTCFLLRIICQKRQDGFSRLMETANSLGLQVIDVNVTTLDGMVLNILKVKANRKDMQAKSLKESLTKLIAHMP